MRKFTKCIFPKYSALANANPEAYGFLSSGSKSTIEKVVNYNEIKRGVVNLGFGDWDEVEQEIKDNIRTINADRERVLATVASTVIDFMQYNPRAILFAEGESRIKTRLYQMGMNANWHQIDELLEVAGFVNGKWELFE